MKTRTEIATPHASKYLQQLCRHWSHKKAVEFTPTTGLVPFAGDASANLRADEHALHIEIEASDPETSYGLQQVVLDHLTRFAFREDLGSPVWRPA